MKAPGGAFLGGFVGQTQPGRPFERLPALGRFVSGWGWRWRAGVPRAARGGQSGEGAQDQAGALNEAG